MNSAVWALIGVIVGTLGTGLINWLLQKNQFQHNVNMYHLQNKSSEVVKQMLLDMLNHKSYVDRSFVTLKAPIGGYSDDEIRQMLHDIEAKKSVREDGSEWWYLLSRRDERNLNRQQPKS